MNSLIRLSRRLRNQAGYTRKTRPLRRGITPPINKSDSLSKAIQKLPLAKELVLPLRVYQSLTLEPVVKEGEAVLKGQVIASLDGFNIHAPSSGTVATIEDRPYANPAGLYAPCIVINTDGMDRWHPSISDRASENFNERSPYALIELIAEAGITGLGGAGFPCHQKLHSATQHNIDTLIINAMECEPSIAADEALLQERATQVVEGIKILQYILHAKTCLVAIEDSKDAAIKQLLSAVEGSDIEVVILPTRYPSGSEQQLIKALCDKELARGQLPASIGVHCQNVATSYAIFEAICLGRPLVSRITTITGDALASCNVEVLLGTPVVDALEFCDENALEKTKSLIFGGPLMGVELANELCPVNATTNCIIASQSQTLLKPEQDCIRCGFCAQVCPAYLLPQQLLLASQQGAHEQARAGGLQDCIECGACNYVCPSHIPLVQYYRAEKAELRNLDAMASRAQHWQQRFENHQARLDKQKATALDRRSRALRMRAKAPQAPIKTDLHDEQIKAPSSATAETSAVLSADQAKSDIQAALARARAKKAQQQQSTAISDKPHPKSEEKE
ncbi:MAG: electron transport complex subunit RsxC [Pseudohongiellaceae bacterium]|nr:electron transport complex subunit RsxC [Pseudohongiellaceae bacterium]